MRRMFGGGFGGIMALAALAIPAMASLPIGEQPMAPTHVSPKASRALRRYRDSAPLAPSSHKYASRWKAPRRAKKPNRLHISKRVNRRHRKAKRAR